MSYNKMGFVSPRGKFYSTNGMSHPDWAHRNRQIVRFVGTTNMDYEPAASECAVFDGEGRTALDYFKDEGWIRVKPDQGIEIGGLHEGNLNLVKAILREMARDNPGRTLYVDDGNSSKHVRASMTGRPDFGEIEQPASANGRHQRRT